MHLANIVLIISRPPIQPLPKKSRSQQEEVVGWLSSFKEIPTIRVWERINSLLILRSQGSATKFVCWTFEKRKTMAYLDMILSLDISAIKRFLTDNFLAESFLEFSRIVCNNLPTLVKYAYWWILLWKLICYLSRIETEKCFDNCSLKLNFILRGKKQPIQPEISQPTPIRGSNCPSLLYSKFV
jgi:hypothetical protein